MIDPELQPFLAMWDSTWSALPSDAGFPWRRAVLERLAAGLRPPLPASLEVEERQVPRDGGTVRVRIDRPKARQPAPCLIFMHGGGWSMGSPETHADITMVIAERNRQVVISVDYRLAPEHPFPAAVEDCAAVVRWAFANAAALGIRGDAIAVGGDSAGGNLAAAMTLMFRGSPQRFQGQLLIYPAVDFDAHRPSHRENADGPIIKTANMPNTLRMYCPDPAQRNNPLLAPLRADSHSGLPPAFIAVAEHDPLRDDGRAYAERLAAARVPVELHPGTGLIHGYLRALTYAAASRAALDAACGWLRRLGG